ncbi:hypothetical protein DFH27DRAFT_632551, partial [Peziza echinospora]
MTTSPPTNGGGSPTPPTTTTTPAPPPRRSPTLCTLCALHPAKIRRPKNLQPLCIPCFLHTFETEVHRTITSTNLFTPGEHIAIGASGGKDSTVLASVLKTLNERYSYGVKFTLLSIDEGIKGYRDESLATVKRNAVQYNMDLRILGYAELFGWTMDEIVSQNNASGRGRDENTKGGSCTYCGVFRRQALDRGAELLGIKHVVTGHNADDVAETTLMNLLRGDVARLGRGADILTKGEADGIKRSKPLKYAYQKEIVLYAHHRKLDYFTTECTYSPEAFRGSARDLVKGLERIRTSAVLDLLRSGEAFGVLLGRGGGGGSCNSNSTSTTCKNHPTTTEEEVPTPYDDDDDEPTTCGSTSTSGLSEMRSLEIKLRKQATTLPSPSTTSSTSPHHLATEITLSSLTLKSHPTTTKKPKKTQTMRKCNKCGYLSSQEVCKACTLLEGLNRVRARLGV